MTNILDYFPGTPRAVQRDILLKVEEVWNKTDIIIIEAPTATGKSRIAKTIQKWTRSADIITPTNMLLEQYVEEFPKDDHVFRAAAYTCKSRGGTCDVPYTKRCKMCPYKEARAKARGSSALTVTYHNYLSLWSGFKNTQRSRIAPVLIVDEAHKLLPYTKDLNNAGGWQHELGYPNSVKTYKDLAEWAAGIDVEIYNPGPKPERGQSFVEYQKNKRKYECLKTIKREAHSLHPTYIMSRYKKAHYSRMKDYLEFTPINLQMVTKKFWKPYHVKKLILMSATFHHIDLDELGIATGRPPQLISCNSPIPAEQRPVYFTPVVHLNQKSLVENEEETVDCLARHICDVLLPKHAEEKGLIHMTYSLAARLAKHPLMQSQSRIRFHSKENKKKQYEDFRNASPKSGLVLIASGMYEGIDLPEDLGRWQAIAKVPWPNLMDPAVAHKTSRDAKGRRWYAWECLKDLIQACGRICRTPDDYGTTYILDKSFQKVYDDYQELFPEWWKESVHVKES